MTTPESNAAPESSPYRGRVVAVGTKHGKQHQFAPAFHRVLGMALLTPPVDTDQFGTFSGEVARAGSAVDAARAKARLAMSVTGLPYGLASEASYGPLPGGWLGHEEILLFCDDRAGIEIVEGYRSSSVPAAGQRVSRYDDVPGTLLDGLPAQALIVRAAGGHGAVTKGITDPGALRSAIATAAANSPDGLALIEPDLRAHHNPSRRLILGDLAQTLAQRLATPCPSCAAPGFGRIDAEPGLPCRTCETPTPLRRNEIHACTACGHQVSRPEPGEADPAHCPSCNP